MEERIRELLKALRQANELLAPFGFRIELPGDEALALLREGRQVPIILSNVDDQEGETLTWQRLWDALNQPAIGPSKTKLDWETLRDGSGLNAGHGINQDLFMHPDEQKGNETNRWDPLQGRDLQGRARFYQGLRIRGEPLMSIPYPFLTRATMHFTPDRELVTYLFIYRPAALQMISEILIGAAVANLYEAIDLAYRKEQDGE